MGEYLNSLSTEQLRCELQRAWDENISLNQDLKALPVVPSLETLRAIQGAAMNIKIPNEPMGLWSRGKALQREHEGIPFRAEDECAAGLWSIIRAALLEIKQDTPNG